MTKGYSSNEEGSQEKEKHRLQETDPREAKGKTRSLTAAVGPESNSLGQ